MMKVCIRWLVLVWAVVGALLVFEGQATNVDNLKGTYSILLPRLRELSPLEGAIAWHTGFIRRLYDLGHAIEGEPQKKPRSEDYKNPDGTMREEEFAQAMATYTNAYKTWFTRISSPSVRVVRKLFYRVPGTTSVADFRLQPHPSIDKKTPTTFAQEIATALVQLWGRNTIVKKEAGVSQSRELQHLSPMSGVATVTATNLGAALDDLVFPGYDTVRLALLAALWFKCGNDRAALRAYFSELTSALKTSKNNWSNSQMKKSLKDSLLAVIPETILQCDALGDDTFHAEEVKSEVGTISDVGVLQDPEVYEKVAYVCLLPANQPEDVPYSKAQLTIGNVDQGKPFSDCADTMIRNFVNHIAYDPERAVFSVEQLKSLTGSDVHDIWHRFCGMFLFKHLKSLTGSDVAAPLRQFYVTNDDPKKANNLVVHDTWAAVISNIPWIAYNRVTTNDQQSYPCKGYVKIPPDGRTDAVRTFLRDKTYTLVEDDTAIVYEFMPSCRNVIIVLNYLCNLNLFAEKNFADEFVRDDFVAEYLPKVFEKFGHLEDGQRDDLGCFKVQLKASGNRQSYRVTFGISAGHGQFSSERLASVSLLVLANMTKENLRGLSLATAFLGSDVQLQSWLRDGYDSRLAFFAQEIDNPEKVLNFLDAMNIPDEHWYNIMKFLVERHADPWRKQYGRSLVMAKAVVSGIECDFVKVILVATEGMKNIDSDTRNAALQLWRALFKKGQAFTQAIEVATEGMKGSSEYMRNAALQLWQALVEKGQAFDQAIAAATEGMKGSSEYMRIVAFRLWRALVEKGQAFDQAITAAIDGMKVRDTRDAALELWRALVEKGQAFDQAIAAATDGMKVRDTRNAALQLWRMLLAKRYKSAFNKAREVLRILKVCYPDIAADLARVLEENKDFEKEPTLPASMMMGGDVSSIGPAAAEVGVVGD